MVSKSSPTGRALGGVARAKALSASERKAIAQQAAAKRWENDIPRAIAASDETPLRIGDRDIDCYVLEDGTRVLSQGGFLIALGRDRKPNTRNPGVPPMLTSAALEPYLTPELLERAQPITFRLPSGVRAYGYRAELLPEVCEVYLKARDAKRLAPNQRALAVQADVLIRGLATVGIIALVDEATKYQEVRTKDALTRILEAFVTKELQAWVKTFPNEFYANLFRLRGLEYPEGTVKRPQYFGQLTNNLIYDRLAPGVREELKRLTPRNEEGRAKERYHQRLTANLGYPKLREHLGSIVTLMRLSESWPEFMALVNRMHPRWDTNLPLPIDYEDSIGL